MCVKDEYHSVNIRARHVFGENYAALFADKASEALEIGMDHGKSRAAQIFETARTAEQSRALAEQDRLLVEENKLANNQRVERDIYSNTLLTEVENRCENLARKTNLMISELND